MVEFDVEKIIKLNKEIKEIVKKNNPKNITIRTKSDYTIDVMKHNFTKDLVNEALLEGLHLEDKDLYPDNLNKKHKRKNWYCIHGYKTGFILIRYLLISYYKNIECIYLFHISPSNNMSEEVRRYKEIKKIVKF